jgi:hypothetical protein
MTEWTLDEAWQDQRTGDASMIHDKQGGVVVRFTSLDFNAITHDLDGFGSARVGPLLDAAECRSLSALYPQDERFRARIVMARHGFGMGEYKYYAYPLPRIIQEIRETLYRPLVPVANRWNEEMGIAVRFPSEHAEFLERCHAAGQTRPTPLLLKYGEGDFNALHQDLYGDNVFPLQVAILLSEPDRDFVGGEFVMTEQRPRMQSRAEVVQLRQGEAVIFAVNHRPVRGSRGNYRVAMRHGVSQIRGGQRFTTGIIFHDAR